MKYVNAKWRMLFSGDNSTLCRMLFPTKFKDAWLDSRSVLDDDFPDEVMGSVPIEDFDDLFFLFDKIREIPKSESINFDLWGVGESDEIRFSVGLSKGYHKTRAVSHYRLDASDDKAALVDAIIAARDKLNKVLEKNPGNENEEA